MIPKLDNGTTKEKNCSLMSLMNIDAKILKKVPETKIIHHDFIV